MKKMIITLLVLAVLGMISPLFAEEKKKSTMFQEDFLLLSVGGTIFSHTLALSIADPDDSGIAYGGMMAVELKFGEYWGVRLIGTYHRMFQTEDGIDHLMTVGPQFVVHFNDNQASRWDPYFAIGVKAVLYKGVDRPLIHFASEGGVVHGSTGWMSKGGVLTEAAFGLRCYLSQHVSMYAEVSASTYLFISQEQIEGRVGLSFNF
jgi:hypothetical protein